MAADSGQKPLQNAMKMAKTAIQLDGGNRHKEAYCEYLRTINYISHALLEEAASQQETVAVEGERMLRLAEQCLERAKSFIGKSLDPPGPPSSSSGPAEPSHTPEDTTPDQTPVSPMTAGHRRMLSDGGEERSPFLPPEVFQRLQVIASQDTSRKELTPIEEASRLNQKLKANYEARLARLPPGQAYQKTSLTLSLQRQMMENLIIAKARQDALQRKMEERRLRLQEEANRRFAASGGMTAEEQEQRLLYTNVLEYEQDHDWPKQWKANMKNNPDASLVSDLVSHLLSRSDHPVVKLLRKHQYRVYNRLYPIVSGGASLRPSHSSNSLTRPETQKKQTTADTSADHQSFISSSSSLSPSHSRELTTEEDEEDEAHKQRMVDRENSFEDLETFLTQLDWTPSDCLPSDPDPSEGNIQEMEMNALKEHLKAVVKDIHIAIDQLLSLTLLSFECLNTSTYKDLCLASLEEAFFPPLWSALVALFRKVHWEREEAFQASVRLYHDALPGDVGVPSKLFPGDSGMLQHASFPYESAVQELKLLVQDGCPQRKLECIVRTLRQICICAEDYRGLNEADSAPKTAAIGADDLLPILSFVALRCQCPQLVSECAALEEFIHEGYLIGEEGYCLTSMQSALAYVESLHTGVAHHPANA
ncbi:VPS9 domain-containing protein 1 [Salarias fasciatus]|uniref:VPS9 domain-containing protein 1 n=1 Tax=Salarias fasciatus TaxID=181472 RepID=UPI001176C1D1|nr:VPS9 domain-containing protein 1 [Salarias fasciatus]